MGIYVRRTKNGRPILGVEPNYQVNISIPLSQANRLREIAASEKRSLSNLIIAHMVDPFLEAHSKPEGIRALDENVLEARVKELEQDNLNLIDELERLKALLQEEPDK